MLHLDENEPDAAREKLSQSLRLFRDTGETPGILRALLGFAWLAACQAQWPRAARLLGAEEEQRAAWGEPLSHRWTQRLASLTERGRAALGEHAFEAEQNAGRKLTLAQAIEGALAAIEAAPD